MQYYCQGGDAVTHDAKKKKLLIQKAQRMTCRDRPDRAIAARSAVLTLLRLIEVGGGRVDVDDHHRFACGGPLQKTKK